MTTGSSNRRLFKKSPHQILYVYLVSRDKMTCSAHGNLLELNIGRIDLKRQSCPCALLIKHYDMKAYGKVAV
jgi:hypothetical protein